jgi:hypothetical protein
VDQCEQLLQAIQQAADYAYSAESGRSARARAFVARLAGVLDEPSPEVSDAIWRLIKLEAEPLPGDDDDSSLPRNDCS